MPTSESSLNDNLITFLNISDNYLSLSKKVIGSGDGLTDENTLEISGAIIACEALLDESYILLVKSIPCKFTSLEKISGLSAISNSKVKILIENNNIELNISNFNLLKEDFNDQYVHLVEKNIDSFILEIDQYELDLVGLEILLKSKAISVDKKIIILNSIDVSLIQDKSSLIALIYEILLNIQVCPILNLQLIETLIDAKMVSTADKTKLLDSHLNNLDIPVILNLLKLLGPPISGIAMNQKPSIDNNEVNKSFALKLKHKGIVSTISESSESLRLYPKRFL